MTDPERWFLTHEGLEHVVEIEDAGLSRRITWTTDGMKTAARKTAEDRVVLDGGDHGAIGLRLATFVGPTRRVTWWDAALELGAVGAAHTGMGGIDLDPEPGSKAAQREAWIRAHPRQYAIRRTSAAVAKVLVPLLLLWLLARFALPAIAWPDWDIPWPSIPWPSIPWPDWGFDIPWPNWSLPEIPDWLRSLLDKVKYVWPVAIALVLARAELKRRRDQDERKRTARQTDGAKRTPTPQTEAGRRTGAAQGTGADEETSASRGTRADEQTKE